MCLIRPLGKAKVNEEHLRSKYSRVHSIMCNLPFRKPIICLVDFGITGVELRVRSISVMRKSRNGRYETGVVHGTMPEDITTITPTNCGINQRSPVPSAVEEVRSSRTAHGLHERVKVGVKVGVKVPGPEFSSFTP